MVAISLCADASDISHSANSLSRFDEDKQSQTRTFLVVAVSCLELL